MKTGVSALVIATGLYLLGTLAAQSQFSTNNYSNFETAPVHPVAMSPDGTKLAVCNLPKGHLELFDITSGVPVSYASIPVGIDPVSVNFRTTNEIWVANYISSTISIIDLQTLRVFNTITTSNQPSDIVFAGNPQLAYVSCGSPNLVLVFDPQTSLSVTNLVIDGNQPRAMTVSPDGSTVYVAIFESGNASTIIGSGVVPLGGALQRTNAVSLASAPSHGIDPPPNDGTNFVPPINPALGTNVPPKVGLIVKKNGAGRWMDDNNGDWTDYISGTNAALTGRVAGWDMPDHDLAVIDTTNFGINYACGLMNICMATAVNPVSGKISVVGTDALNNIRFTPVLQSIFIRVNLAQVDPVALTSTITDLNPHLDYQSPQVSSNEVMMSIGDPRGMVWSSYGTRAYVSGMGSDNVIIIDAQGARAGLSPTINVGQGPTGMALDESRGRLYVYNRFDDSISTIDTVGENLVSTLQLFDPTPQVIKVGRPHLYNTHQSSGLGQAACASCHVDARFDRLAWDLGDPTGTMNPLGANNFLTLFPPSNTNGFHPMKGPMVTQTLQNIIGHEPFHWRGDREGIEAFAPTFNDLQGVPGTFSTNQMAELKGFLATIGFGPNPYRLIDNSLSTNLALPGQLALGRSKLPAGAQLPNGNAQAGQSDFLSALGTCIECHTLPTGLGPDRKFIGGTWQAIALSTNGSHHVALNEAPRTSNLAFKIPSLRNLTDKMGMSYVSTNSRAGFGFFNDGSVDTLVRFLQDGFPQTTNDQTTADMVAFLVSFTGSDLVPGQPGNEFNPPGLSSLDTPAGAGRQVTVNSTNDVPLVDTMLTPASSGTNRVDLIVKGMKNGIARGWFFNTTNNTFLSDRHGETYSPAGLRALAAPGSELTYMLVPKGLGVRLGIDRDLDENYDGDLVVKSWASSKNGMTISWTSVVGLNYQVQYKNALSDPSWNTLPNSVAGTGNTISMTDTTVGANRARFYRVTTIEE